MITLRALVGASFLLVVMGLVVIIPLGWSLVLGIAATSPEKIVQGQPYQQNDEQVQIKYKIVAKEK